MENLEISFEKLNNPSKEIMSARDKFLKECEELEINMKPEIGTKVYCIYGDGILVDEVAFIGKDSFIIESFHNTYEDSWEWNYEDYEEKWFTDLERAKEELLSKYGDSFIIENVTDDWFQVLEE